MKKKYAEDDSENEFSVDEPEELEESDDDWTPSASETRGRRQSRRGRSSTSAKKPRLAEPRTSEDEEDAEEEDEEEEEEEEDESQPESEEETNERGKRRRGRATTTPARGGRGRAKKIAATPTSPASAAKDKGAVSDLSCTATSEIVLPSPVEQEFTSGAFVVLKADFKNQKDPPIWKIDGKALLQKYVPFEQDGKILYRNTSTYSGWSTVLKDRYYPAQINFKMQNRKETVVEFLRDKIKVEDSE